MVGTLLVCSCLFAVSSDEASPTAASPTAVLAAYRDAEAEAGKGSDAQVKLALWCEAHGLASDRMKHLARAVLADPSNATARGLLGLVAYDGRWARPEAVAEKIRTDEQLTAALAEYNSRRERTPETADAHWKLALWCEQKGLRAEALAHLTAVTRLDPRQAKAWTHLGYKVHGGRWMTPEMIAAESAEAAATARADRLWRPRLERLKGYLAFKDKGRKADVEARLAEVTDPRAVPSVLAVLGSGNAEAQLLAVQVLGQIASPESSRALADVAASARSEAVRRAAAETLRRRDPREFVDRLIARLEDPIRYHVRPVAGPGQAGELLIEGDRFNLGRVYEPPPLPRVPVTPGSTVERDLAGSVVINVALVVSNTAVLNFLTPALTWAMITQSLEPVFRTPLNTRTLGSMPNGRSPAALPLPRVIETFLGRNSGLSAVPLILNPLAPWVASLDGVQTQAPIAAGSRMSGPNQGAPPSMPQPPIPVPIERMVREIQTAASESRAQQRADIKSLEERNAAVRKANDRVVLTLEAVLGRSLGSSRSDWERWWNDQRGYVLASRSLATKPTVFEDVTPDYTPRPVGRFVYDRQIGYYTPPTDCFAAGTTVQTIAGPRAIESIKLGDRLLAQDTATGALRYEPVLAVHHNPPVATLRLDLGAETIVTTDIQRFWQARKGWLLARDLKPGNEIRTLAGLARVVAVDSDLRRPVFNLDVAAGHDFFVGSTRVLAHDHTVVEPVERPFDGAPEIGAVAARP
jgi:hypothetical protein